MQGYRFLLVFVVFFVLTSWFVGWQTAYEVCTLIKSPREVGYPWLTVPLSLEAWLVVPGFAGALAGIVVVEVAGNRRGRLADRPAGKAHGGEIPLLYRLQFDRHDYDIPEYFALRFAQRHDNKWLLAQDHWEILVERFLTIEAFDRKLGSRHVMGQAVSATAYFLRTLSGKCPECARAVYDADRKGRIDGS